MNKPDIERVRDAMQMVWKHKAGMPIEALHDCTWNDLAEAATKMMWLIEEENRTKGSEGI